MDNARFLLLINCAIGLSFAAAFLALTWKARIPLGVWCAAGFLAASATVTTELLAHAIPSVRLTSTLSFGSLMLALSAITIGLIRHYRLRLPIAPLVVFAVAAILFNAFVVFDWPRGTFAQTLGYQTPFAAMLAVACVATAVGSPRRGPDLALAGVLGLSSAQFLIKAILGALAHPGAGLGVRAYIRSDYAFYSQTAGGILSILLGLALVGVIVREALENMERRFERDGLSGVLTRSAFVTRALAWLKAPANGPFVLVIADLDHFKSVNDQFGHAAGDEVIRAFGATLEAHFGPAALCGRLGGEEFCVLLGKSDGESAHALLDGLLARQRAKRHASLPVDRAVTASCGAALIAPGEPFELALHRADMALYEAKAGGRDGYRFAKAAVGDRRDPQERGAFRIRTLPR